MVTSYESSYELQHALHMRSIMRNECRPNSYLFLSNKVLSCLVLFCHIIILYTRSTFVVRPTDVDVSKKL